MSQCLRVKNWENLRKSWKCVRSTQNIVMDEEFVKHSVVKAKSDPKVVVVPIPKLVGGRNYLQPSNSNLSEEYMDEESRVC